MEKQELTQEQKIEYIYNYVKKEERNARVRRYIKIVLFCLFIGYFYIAIFVLLPKTLENMLPDANIDSIKSTLFGK